MSMESYIKSLQRKFHRRTIDIPQPQVKPNEVIATCNQKRCKICRKIKERDDFKAWIQDGSLTQGCSQCYMAYVNKYKSQDAPDYIGCGYS